MTPGKIKRAVAKMIKVEHIGPPGNDAYSVVMQTGGALSTLLSYQRSQSPHPFSTAEHARKFMIDQIADRIAAHIEEEWLEARPAPELDRMDLVLEKLDRLLEPRSTFDSHEYLRRTGVSDLRGGD